MLPKRLNRYRILFFMRFLGFIILYLGFALIDFIINFILTQFNFFLLHFFAIDFEILGLIILLLLLLLVMAILGLILFLLLLLLVVKIVFVIHPMLIINKFQRENNKIKFLIFIIYKITYL